VQLLQQALNFSKLHPPALKDDGIFGAKTRARVVEFQMRQKLQVDGIVGNQTHSELTAAYEKLADWVKEYMPPPEIAQLRKRIVEIAKMEQQVFGWPLGPTSGGPSPSGPSGTPLPPPFSSRIAAFYLSDKATRARQGGPKLAFIFGVAGAGTEQIDRCWTIKQGYCYGEGEITYENYKAVRNQFDLVSWCGIFALYVYRSAGVMLPRWTANPFAEGANMKSILASEVGPGDLGKLEPYGGRNHHFIVTDVVKKNFGGKDVVVGVNTIDGNDGLYQSIVTHKRDVAPNPQDRHYTISGKLGVFMSPTNLHGG
jgi:hypothetical protein